MVLTIFYRSFPKLPKLFFIYFSKSPHRVTEQIFEFARGPTQKHLMVFIENPQYLRPVRAHLRIYFFEYPQMATRQLSIFLPIPMARIFYFFLTYCFLICLTASFVFSGSASAIIFALLIINIWDFLKSLASLCLLLISPIETKNFLKLLGLFHKFFW